MPQWAGALRIFGAADWGFSNRLWSAIFYYPGIESSAASARVNATMARKFQRHCAASLGVRVLEAVRTSRLCNTSALSVMVSFRLYYDHVVDVRDASMVNPDPGGGLERCHVLQQRSVSMPQHFSIVNYLNHVL